jgi:glycerate dehydrogenase
MALLLALTNRIREYGQAAVDGRWSRSSRFCLTDFPVFDLAGKTLGIVGYGQLGQAVARLAHAFGMQVVVAEGQGGPQAGRLPLEVVLRTADVLSLHCLLSPASECLINADTLRLMQPSALLLNTARGGLIDEMALAAALREGRLAGAALDVLSVEPPPPGHPLLAADIPNLLITPHCAWGSRAARQRLLDVTTDNIAGFLDRRPPNP